MATTQEAVAAAFDKLEEANAPATADVAGGPPDASGGGDTVSASQTPLSEGAAPEAPGETVAPAGDGRARDASGKFVKSETDKTKAPKAAKPTVTDAPKAAQAVTTGQPAQGTPSATPTPKYKPPQAWKPAVREKWASLPEDVQEEVDRLERDTKRALMEAAKPKEFHQQFQQIVAPYEGMIRAEGGDPLRVVGNMLQTAVALRTAPPAHKAMLVAQLVKQFGVPVDALDSALAGETPQAHAPQQIDPSQIAAQVRAQLLQEIQSQREQAIQQRAQKELEELAPTLEFFEDLRPEIAALQQGFAGQGRAMDLKSAYNRALLMHKADPDSEIGRVLRQREAAEAANAARASTQRAHAAATSVKSQPAPRVDGGRLKTSREAAEAAWEKLSGR